MGDAGTTLTMFPVGIVQDKLKQAERPLPNGEPPPLPVNAELSVIGKPPPRLDGKLKVTGAAKYTADIQLPGMLYARRLCSPHPHARIKAIDVSAAEKFPGVRAVHVVERAMGGAQLRDSTQETPSKWPLIRYVGQATGPAPSCIPPRPRRRWWLWAAGWCCSPPRAGVK